MTSPQIVALYVEGIGDTYEDDRSCSYKPYGYLLPISRITFALSKKIFRFHPRLPKTNTNRVA